MKNIKTGEKNNKIERKAISKQIDKKISNKVFINIIIAIAIMSYFCTMSIAYKNVEQTQIVSIVKIATLIFLGITLILIELAYKKENTRLFIHSLEALALAVHSLTTMHVIRIYGFDFQNYILTSSYIFSIYYVLKAIVINTKARHDYLKGLSDIYQIVQKEEPSKKEASKKEKLEESEQELKRDIKKKKEKSSNRKEKQEIPQIEETTEYKEDENTEIKDKVKQENKNIKDLEEKIQKNRANSSKIASIRAKLEKIQDKGINENTDKSKQTNKKVEEEKRTEQNETEKQEQPKPKRKRGRPKKEVKIND